MCRLSERLHWIFRDPLLGYNAAFNIKSTPSGHLNVTAVNPELQLLRLDLDMCKLFRESIEKEESTIAKDAEAAAIKVINGIAEAISEKFPETVYHGPNFNVSLLLSAPTGTPSSHLVLAGLATVVNSAGQRAPALQRYPLPSLNTSDPLFHIGLGDSMLSNVMWGILQNTDLALNFTGKIDGKTWNLTLGDHSPFASVSIQGGDMLLSLDATLSGSVSWLCFKSGT